MLNSCNCSAAAVDVPDTGQRLLIGRARFGEYWVHGRGPD